jgi:hypothetical protein
MMMDVVTHARQGAIDAADSAAAVSRALAELSAEDLLRLQALARLRARGLPSGVVWSDLLHEALARALDGSRQWPAGVPLLAFLAAPISTAQSTRWDRSSSSVSIASRRTMRPPTPGRSM